MSAVMAWGEPTRIRTRREANVCPECHYIGDRHLCGCVTLIGEALEAGDLTLARGRFRSLVDRANLRRQLREGPPPDPATDPAFRSFPLDVDRESIQ